MIHAMLVSTTAVEQEPFNFMRDWLKNQTH